MQRGRQDILLGSDCSLPLTHNKWSCTPVANKLSSMLTNVLAAGQSCGCKCCSGRFWSYRLSRKLLWWLSMANPFCKGLVPDLKVRSSYLSFDGAQNARSRGRRNKIIVCSNSLSTNRTTWTPLCVLTPASMSHSFCFSAFQSVCVCVGGMVLNMQMNLT